MGSLDYVSNPADLPPGTLSQLFLTAVEDRREELAFRYFPGDGDHLENMSYGAVYELVRVVSGGLQALGMKRGDRAAILSETRMEWSVCDYACICTGVLDRAHLQHADRPPGGVHPGELGCVAGLRVDSRPGGEGRGREPGDGTGHRDRGLRRV